MCESDDPIKPMFMIKRNILATYNGCVSTHSRHIPARRAPAPTYEHSVPYAYTVNTAIRAQLATRTLGQRPHSGAWPWADIDRQIETPILDGALSVMARKATTATPPRQRPPHASWAQLMHDVFFFWGGGGGGDATPVLGCCYKH